MTSSSGLLPRGQEPTGFQQYMKRFLIVYVFIMVFANCVQLFMDPSIIASLIVHLGGNAVMVGFADTSTYLGSIGSAFLAAYVLGLMQSYRRMTMIFSFASLLNLIMILASIIWLRSFAAIIMVTIGIFIYNFIMGSLSLPWNGMLKQEISGKARAKYISSMVAGSFVIASVVSLGIRWILQNQHLVFPYNYVVLFGGAVALAFCYFVLTTVLKKEDASSGSSYEIPAKMSLKEIFAQELKHIREDKQVRIFLLAVSCFAVSWSTTGMFITLGFKKAPDLMEDILANGILWRTMVKACCFLLAGKIAAAYGNKFVLIAIGFIGLIAPLSVLFLPVESYMVVLITTNLMSMAYLYFMNHMLDVCSNETFNGRFTSFMIVTLPITLAMPLLGLLVEHWPVGFCLTVLIAQLLGLYFIMRIPRFVYNEST